MADPVLLTLAPAYANVGATDPITLSINGTGFDETAVLVWNGADDICEFVSDTLITTQVSMNLVTVASDATVAVRVNEVLSNELIFQFRDAVPVPPDAGELPPAEDYTENDGTYSEIAAATSEPSVATGQPAEAGAPVTNEPGGGLPESPREPYPTGNPPQRSYGEINSGSV
jgi:hypothetical protein